jgi:hypothetical protein
LLLRVSPTVLYFTFTFTLFDDDALKFASPPFCALIVCVPIASVVVVRVAVPLIL